MQDTNITKSLEGTGRYLITRYTVEEADLFEALPPEFKETISEVHFAERLGMMGTYGIDLDEEWAQRVRGASNLVDLLDLAAFGLGASEWEPPVEELPDAEGALEEFPDPPQPDELDETGQPPAFAGAPGGLPRRRARMWQVGPTLNQGKASACVGFAGTHFLNAAPVRKGFEARYAFALYDECQRNDNRPGENYRGTSVEALRIVLQKRGLLKQAFFARTFEGARKWTLNRGGVIYVMDWYEGMYRANAQGYIRPTGKKVERHCIFSPGQNAWGDTIMQNSWGPGFGLGGKCWFSKADHLWMRSNDKYYRALCAVHEG
jgi:hypothetical protein